VQHGHPRKPRAEPTYRLRREADFRHQHDRLAAEVDHLLDRLDVNLRLAATGYAVDQDRLGLSRVQRSKDRIERHLLIRVEYEMVLEIGGRFDHRFLANPIGT